MEAWWHDDAIIIYAFSTATIFSYVETSYLRQTNKPYIYVSETKQLDDTHWLHHGFLMDFSWLMWSKNDNLPPIDRPLNASLFSLNRIEIGLSWKSYWLIFIGFLPFANRKSTNKRNKVLGMEFIFGTDLRSLITNIAVLKPSPFIQFV